MNFPATGIALIVVGILTFFWAPRYLYWLTVAFLGFSATAVVNVGSSDSASGVQAWMLFGFLWICRDARNELSFDALCSLSSIQGPVRWLRYFLIVAVASLIMPLWIGGRISVDSPEMLSTDSAPLVFSFRHITQVLYLIFGATVALCVILKNRNIEDLKRSIKVYVISAILVGCWGLVQWGCYHANVPYPSSLFNTNAAESATGYLQTIEDLDLTRVSSVATEPSMLAEYLLTALVLVLFAVMDGRSLISQKWDRVGLLLIGAVLLLTTSTTAYLGLALLLPMALWAAWYMRTIRIKFLLGCAATAAALAFVYAHFSVAQDVVTNMVFSKGETYSGVSRLNSVVMARDYFMQYPLLGLGWGSVTSLDLIFKLLANVGVLGCWCFVTFIVLLFSQLWRAVQEASVQYRNSELSHWRCCLLVCGSLVILVNCFVGFAFVYGHFWFIIGLTLAACVVTDRRRDQQASGAVAA